MKNTDTVKTRLSNEERFERYLTSILDKAIEEFEKDNTTISFEDWKEEIRRDYNVKF